MPDLDHSHPLGPASHNLPVQLTSFIGREREVEELTQLIGETRLLTLTGAGGVGKTRLGLEVASQMPDDFEDGIWLVELGSIFEPELVALKISSTFGLRGEGSKTRSETLQEHLEQKALLLVLDNCEHLLQACAELIAGLLLTCPNLRVLASSREPLGVPGEMVYQVHPLSLPDKNQSSNLEELVRSEAVQLFIERARAFQPSFQVDAKLAPAIARVCLLLDGIPLAVELAAARVRILSLPQIAEYLEDSLRLLTRGGSTVESRQQTLQASMDWSYGLLNEREQVLFRRLAVFAGRFLMDDIEAVCSGGDTEVAQFVLPSNEVLDLLSNLVDKSLVMVIPSEETSYRMLNPIHLFALDKLSESGEQVQLRNRHLNHYLELAQKAHPILKYAEQIIWMNRLDLEIDNFRFALDWSLQSEMVETGLHLACELGEFWWRQGYASEGLTWLNRLLDKQNKEDQAFAHALVQAARLSREMGNYKQAKSFCDRSLELSRELDYQEGVAEALCLLGIIEHYYVGNLEKVIELLEEGLAIFLQLGDEWKVATNRLYLADAKHRIGEYEQADGLFRECLAFFQEIGDQWGISFALGGVGDLTRLRGDYEEALILFRESVEINVEMGDILAIAYLYEGIATTYIEQKRFQPAVRLWGFVGSLRDSIHSLLPLAYQEYYAAYLETARSALGEDAYETALQEGGAFTLEQATALALQPTPGETETSPSTTPDPAEKFGLTGREVEVLRLVASGLTDAQVGEQLFISPRTVSKHLQSIYGKIQVNSRSAATRFALEHDLA